MPNKPRPENRHRMVRVEDDLWEAARVAASREGTTRAQVMRTSLRELVERNMEVSEVTKHPADALLDAIDAAEDQARTDHESGTCRDSEWSCSYCEEENRG